MPEVCDWCENGEWWQACDDDGELLYEFVFEGILSLILKEYYMPPLVEQLNSECLLSRFLTDEDDLAVST
jgi:hypothetical protein